jgi:uncharacterized membrane protein HdeD (DUF308 family)
MSNVGIFLLVSGILDVLYAFGLYSCDRLRCWLFASSFLIILLLGCAADISTIYRSA